MEEHALGFDTLQLHAGQVLDSDHQARAVPIYQTTSFVFKNYEHAKKLSSVEEFGHDYTRITNPTNEVLENRIAALEGGSGALSVASGSAATAMSILNITHAGDEIVAAETLYGGSFNLFVNTLPKHGVRTVFVDPDDPDNFNAAITDKTKAVFIETIGNPVANIIDIEKVAKVAHAHGIPLIVDNTFATPYLCKPFEYGANIIVHSATKYIGGHGNSIGGLIVDGGNFDWAQSGKFPDFTTPDKSYSNFIFSQRWGDWPGAGNIAFIVKALIGLRPSEEVEVAGLDLADHGEEGYLLPSDWHTHWRQNCKKIFAQRSGGDYYLRRQRRLRQRQKGHRASENIFLPGQCGRLKIAHCPSGNGHTWAAYT